MSVAQITHTLALQGMLQMTMAQFDYLRSGLLATVPFMTSDDVEEIIGGGDVEALINKYDVDIVKDDMNGELEGQGRSGGEGASQGTQPAIAS